MTRSLSWGSTPTRSTRRPCSAAELQREDPWTHPMKGWAMGSCLLVADGRLQGQRRAAVLDIDEAGAEPRAGARAHQNRRRGRRVVVAWGLPLTFRDSAAKLWGVAPKAIAKQKNATHHLMEASLEV